MLRVLWKQIGGGTAIFEALQSWPNDLSNPAAEEGLSQTLQRFSTRCFDHAAGNESNVSPTQIYCLLKSTNLHLLFIFWNFNFFLIYCIYESVLFEWLILPVRE